METRKRRKLLDAKPVEKEDEAAKVLKDKVFSISLVTDCIFQHFSNKDLLSNCSVVSLVWNSAVKEYLYRCRKCLLQCNVKDIRGMETQHRLLKNRLLTNCLPFSGINLIITPQVSRLLNDTGGKPSSRIRSTLQDIMSLIDVSLTHVTLTNYEYSYRYNRGIGSETLINQFPAYVLWLVQTVLFPLLSQFEIRHLHLINFDNSRICRWSKWFENVETNGFSTLETITFDPIFKFESTLVNYDDSVEGVDDYKAFLRTCPKLKEMPIVVIEEAVKIIDTYDRMPLVKRLAVKSGPKLEFGSELFNALTKINDNLVYVVSQCSACSPIHFQSLGRILQLHSNSLKEISLEFRWDWPIPANDVESSNELFRLNFPPLPFVKNVYIRYLGVRQQLDSNLVPKRHNVLQMFPNASIVIYENYPVITLSPTRFVRYNLRC